MARSSTTYTSKWRNGVTTVVRVPKTLAKQVLEYAQELDTKELCAQEAKELYRTAADVCLDEPINVAAVPQRSPFRYPGGKTWLVPYIRSWLQSRNKRPNVLVEPFAGGGIVGLTAGFEHLAEHVVLVEKDEDIAAVWRTMLGGQAEWLAQRIEQFDLTKKNVLSVLNAPATTQREKAFATVLRNRVQRGGIMAPGAGLVKTGENGRGLASRWYPETLARRIRAIDAMKHRFSFIEGDGLAMIEAYADDENAVFYVDPPYTLAARRLYPHWQIDHERLFALLSTVAGHVLMTYDDAKDIWGLSKKFRFDVQTITMKNTHHAHMKELLVGKDLTWLRNAQVSGGSRARTAQAKQACLL